MELQRTTIRVRKDIFQKAKRRTIEAETSFQELVNQALLQYLDTPPNKTSRPLRLNDKPLGVPNKITREYIYQQ